MKHGYQEEECGVPEAKAKKGKAQAHHWETH